ncbi:MAG TPA: stage V sporulation protein S [Firmicutes bacterium]|nr:stage V sporulation protein S [Bacillota bacterium]
MQTLKASSTTVIQKLAGSIAINIRSEGVVTVTVVGASALNQAVKACIVARRFLKDDGNCDITVQPSFVPIASDRPTDGAEPVTGVQLLIKKAPIEPLPEGATAPAPMEVHGAHVPAKN